jgi:hypothetical protein
VTWFEKIIAAHTAVTGNVSHGGRMKSDRYFVWQEEGADDLILDNRHAEKAVTGSTDLFTKNEFDPWKDAFEKAMDDANISYRLNSVQFEPDTGFWHYEWKWTV